MFLEWLKTFIKNNPEVYMVTNRGLESITNKVIFSAKDLDTRYPELKELLPGHPKKVEVQEQVNVVEDIVAQEKPKKGKKK